MENATQTRVRNPGKVRVTVWLPEALAERLEYARFKQREPMSQIVEGVLDKTLPQVPAAIAS